MAVTVTCGQCGESFEAERQTRKYCGDRCRQQARRRTSESEAAEIVEAIAGVPLVDLLGQTRADLEEMNKTDTVLGQQALVVATRMTSAKDTGSAIAALSRELDRIMLRLRSGASAQEDEVGSARRRRDEKRRQAAEARQA